MFLHQEQTYLANRLKLSTSTTNQSSNNTNHHYHQHQLPQLDAVIIRNLTYEAGRGRGKRVILNKINLTVPEGSIYGLLGPSGCGKTTMLRCIVGRIRARSGSVLVFGLSPGAGQGEVPGKDVGYMPQEISIYEDFTIEETLIYFGKINRMPENDIKKRVEFLLQFLDLPSRKRLVVNLSGGQKRRVSLAAALVHSPPLLILDEPTVGVDPLLRQSIWEHLVSLTQTERISVIITTHYIEEARQANVVGLMRHGKILAEDSPEDLMRLHQLSNLEDVFLKLCVTDSSRRAAQLATSKSGLRQTKFSASQDDHSDAAKHNSSKRMNQDDGANHYEHRWDALAAAENRTKASGGTNTKPTKLDSNLFTRTTVKGISDSSHESSSSSSGSSGGSKTQIRIHTGTNKVELIDINGSGGHVNEAVEVFSSDDDISSESSREPIKSDNPTQRRQLRQSQHDSRDSEQVNYRNLIERAAHLNHTSNKSSDINAGDYLAMQAMKWATRRTTELNLMSFRLDRGYHKSDSSNLGRHQSAGGFRQWCTTLMAVTWKNYIRLRRNPPVLVFQFMLPAIQVILFCLCIGGDPFDVPVAIVNDEVVPRSSLQFLNGLNRKIIRQVKYDNLTSAMEAVRRGSVWGAIHIPDKYSQNLQTRLIMGEEVTNETISNGTIRVYPDLTNLHLALALETTFRETFINFARDSLEELGYDRSLADLPIQIGKPVYGNMKKDGYLEFMAPGVVISISYVMATGLTALAFILERRDGLLERSLVSGVQTGQILLAHAINQVVVMVIQIFLVLGCTFFVFEIPSRGPFFWVVLLILLQGCTGMGFGLLVSAVCEAENTAVMMVVGTFYTNLILAGIIWPIEAMPHWLRPLSYAQPQTLPTDTLRHILSRGWGITEPAVLLGFAVTVGWLVIFLMAAGLIFKYSR